MKLQVLVLFVVLLTIHAYTLEQIITSVQDPPPVRNCSLTTYVGEGEVCDESKNIQCKLFHKCKEGKCVLAHVGTTCTQSTDCLHSSSRALNIRCVAGKCVKPKYNGFECSDNIECFGGQCTNGICTGLEENTFCDPTGMVKCNKGLYCSNTHRSCKKVLEFGSKCNDWYGRSVSSLPEGSNYFIICKGGHKCMGPRGNQVCIPYKSGRENSPCNYNRDRDDECQFGLYCHPKHNQCLKDPEYPTFQCKGAAQPCIRSEHHSCICENGDPNKGTCKSVVNFRKCDYFNSMNKYRSCLERYDCPFERNFMFSMVASVFETKSCPGKYCGAIIREYLCCSLSSHASLSYSWAEVKPLGCTSLETSNYGPAIAVVVVLFLLFVAIGIALASGLGIFIYIKQTSTGGFEELK